jgi:hypothetical protein
LQQVHEQARVLQEKTVRQNREVSRTSQLAMRR